MVYDVNFIFFNISGISRTLLGSDFLKQHGLLVDIQKRHLADPVTTLFTPICLDHSLPIKITAIHSKIDPKISDRIQKHKISQSNLIGVVSNLTILTTVHLCFVQRDSHQIN